MELIGQTVKHKIFGNGIIVNSQGNKIKVKFDTQTIEKTFIYPDCFKSFLILENKNLLEELEQDIKKSKKYNENNLIKQQNQRIIHEISNPKMNKGKSVKDTQVVRFNNIDAFSDFYSKQIQSEITFLRKNGGKHINIYDGKFIMKQSSRYYYEFDTDTELSYPDGTQITLYLNGYKEIKGTLEFYSEFTILISTTENLGYSKDTEISNLEFSVESWWLLDSLNEQVKLMKYKSTSIMRSLVSDGLNQIEFGKKIKTGQDIAVNMSKENPITFIWGPPGTGKTQTLAEIALEHMKLGNRILMLSYSNVSVDGAINRVFELASNSKYNFKIEPGNILRCGYPKDKNILESEYISTFNYVLYANPEMVAKRNKILNDIKKYKKSNPEYMTLKKQLNDIRQKLSLSEIESIKNAKFVATTVSKVVVDKELSKMSFDVVIFDEASMSYIPQIVFGAGIAKKHFICIGDFCQLPPIVQGDNSEALSINIFKYCGISDALDKNCNHKWLCMLDTQRRMHPQIADIANVFMYHDLLKTEEGIKKVREYIQNSVPELLKAYGLVDLSYMMSTCISMKDGSRVNVLSAIISFALAQRAYDNNFEVGIISPYSAQAGLLHCMAIDQAEYNKQKSSQNESIITCATVHQFQGSEKDVIIYDAVDCYRQTHPGILLTGMKDNYANKLFNVAMTRAKGKFVAVANAKFMADKGIKTNLMFGQLIEKSKNMSSIDGHILECLDCGNHSCFKFYRKELSEKDFLQDIQSAKKSVYIDIPNKPTYNITFFEKLAKIIQQKKSKNIKVIVRAEKRSTIPNSMLPFTIEHSYAMNPVVIIDKSITWYGMPWSEAEFKTENGIIHTKYYPIIRFIGSKTSRKLYGLLEMNKTTDESIEVLESEETYTLSQYILKNKKCSVCSKSMQLKKSKNGKFYLSCTGYPTCTYTELLTLDLVEEYLYFPKDKTSRTLVPRCKCIKCNYSIEAKLGRYGIYLQCCGLQKHKYKLDEI